MRFPALAHLCLGLLLLSGAACTGVEPPRPPAGAESAVGTPVVLVPGLTGVKLRRRDNGKVVWGRGLNVLLPRDGGYRLALPLPGGDLLEPFEVVDQVSLLWITEPAYLPIYRLLEGAGYRRGDLTRPRRGDGFFPFVYDWRRDKVGSAALLVEQLEALRRVRGEPRLRVTLLCQSCGAHLCRWVAKYGAAGLGQAESGGGGLPPGLEVANLILVGSSNGGSLRILRELDRGRRYVWMGRHWQPEVLFTYPSLYQDLPIYRRDLFLDGEGRPLEVDVYDPASWRRYGWSVFGATTRSRLARRARPDLFAGPQERQAFLARALDRARRFQTLLAEDSPAFGPTRYHTIQNFRLPTPGRAVLVEDNGGWRTLFSGDKELLRRGLADLATAPGDGHATVESQEYLSPQESAALATTLHPEGDHFGVLLDPATGERLLEILAARGP